MTTRKSYSISHAVPWKSSSDPPSMTTRRDWAGRRERERVVAGFAATAVLAKEEDIVFRETDEAVQVGSLGTHWLRDTVREYGEDISREGDKSNNKARVSQEF